MSSFDDAEVYAPSVPSMLDLVRLSPKRLFPPGGAELYRQIAILTDMSQGLEVLDVASGKGVPLEYFATEFGVTAAGVDIDPAMVESAENWSRELNAGDRLQFQTGRSDALPYRDEIFDVAIGEIGLANHCEPADAVRELVRVTKPGGFIVLVQLVWKAPVDEARRAVLSDHLGARPLMVVEWKRLLREAGVEDIHVEDWSDEETAFRADVVKPFPDFAEMFSLGERLGILRRAWKRWGWRGVSSAIARENEVHKLLTSERILGLDLLRGRRAPLEESAQRSEGGGLTASASAGSVTGYTRGGFDAPKAEPGHPRSMGERPDHQVPTALAALPHPADAMDMDEPEADDAQADTEGLPLFGGEPDKGDERE
jgi:ubiquinone/menaquinone biosynthesis C-methylase UbiE